MSSSITIDSAGRVVLPSEVRRRLNLSSGTRLRVEIVAERIELTPEPDEQPQLVKRGKRLVLKQTGNPFDAAAAVREERELQGRRGNRR